MGISKLVIPIVNEINIYSTLIINPSYYSPSYPTEANLKSLRSIWNYNNYPDSGNVYFTLNKFKYKLSVENNNSIIKNYSIDTQNIEEANRYIDLSPSIVLPNGRNIIKYEIYYSYKLANSSFVENFTVTYNVYITEDTEPLPKWNAYTVLDRVLNVVEPLRQGETPRFKIDENQETWLKSIETPEFQFTQSTLREILQGVGSYIHAEPRLIKNKEEYIITFDKYGGNTYSEFATTYKTYASQQQSINIENFATNLDSSVDNFINSFENSVNGSISEPFYDGYKSVLAEGSYVRITDESMYIYTQYPIYSVKKLTCSAKGKTGDITPYVFESAEYNKLSSYDNMYPTSKSYALYYTIGQNGIYGLNFKREQIHSEWSNYSLIKIINTALNVNIEVADLKNIGFNVEYVPIYPARVQQNKSIISAGKKWTKPYNQGQNLIETQYYGQNLKGVIARLGNIDKTLT